MQVILTSGVSLSFDSLQSILEWSHNWALSNDGETVYNVVTGLIVGHVVY